MNKAEMLVSKYFVFNQNTPFQKEQDVRSKLLDFGEKQVLEADGVVRRTAMYLGTPVFSDLVLEDANGLVVYLGETLLVITQTKNIVTTSVVGRNGTIKEYVSDGDFQIKIQGLIVSNGTIYPKESVLELVRLFQKSEPLAVTSWYLQQFGIYNIVVTDYSFPQNEGYQNMQLFEISALSDTPVELIVSD
jgi:hypothetical protein